MKSIIGDIKGHKVNRSTLFKRNLHLKMKQACILARLKEMTIPDTIWEFIEAFKAIEKE